VGKFKYPGVVFTSDERREVLDTRMRKAISAVMRALQYSAVIKRELSKKAAWPKGLKRHFHGDRVITIAWSRFNSHTHRARCCVLE